MEHVRLIYLPVDRRHRDASLCGDVLRCQQRSQAECLFVCVYCGLDDPCRGYGFGDVDLLFMNERTFEYEPHYENWSKRQESN